MIRRVVVVLVLTAGCSGGSVPSTDESTPRGRFLQYSRALCEKLVSCEETVGRGYSGVDACVSMQASAYDCPLVDPLLAMNLDDPAAVGPCTEAIAQMPCSSLGYAMVMPEACDSLLRVARTQGASCQNGRCLGDLECQAASAAGGCATCQPGGAASTPCDDDYACAESLFCDTSGGSGVCAPRKGDGSACDTDRECSSDWCRESTGTCATPLPAGSACTTTDLCEGARGCVAGTCGDRVSLGGACTDDGECVVDALCDGGVCAAIDHCASPNVGHSCLYRCATGAYCSILSPDPTCQPVLADGATCDFVPANVEGQCGSGSSCSLATSQCTAVVAIGSPCALSDRCADSGFCDTSVEPPVCVAPGGVGAHCTSPFQCATWNCDLSTQQCAEVGVCAMP